MNLRARLLRAFLRGFLAELAYMAVCPWCARRAPFHTNSAYSIGGGARFPVHDLHEVDDARNGGVGLRECLAFDLRKLLTKQP